MDIITNCCTSRAVRAEELHGRGAKPLSIRCEVHRAAQGVPCVDGEAEGAGILLFAPELSDVPELREAG
jgi:hypothetical protein